jgi:cytochrome P450
MDASAHRDHRERAYTLPLEHIDVSDPQLYQDDVWRPYFERLRCEDPVHWCEDGVYGSYWSITKYHDILKVESDHATYSSDARRGGIALGERPADLRLPSFIAMDPPKHTRHRQVVSPIVAPRNLALLAGTIRERAARILDDLPRNETFDWVDRVSIELTTQMLATLFDFPQEERRKLTYWSNVSILNVRAGGPISTQEKRQEVLMECLTYFSRLWEERARAEPKPDLLSMLAQGEATRDLPRNPKEFLGTLLLLIAGGNDTTRNSVTGGLLALTQFPDEWRKLRENPALVESMVPEIIRWQTPVAHMRRTAVAASEIGSKRIRAGDKVAMWYISGNRDEDVIERGDDFIIDRRRPRQHLSFGFGIHRCLGERLAELQLKIVWEEILKRFPVIEVVGPPQRIYSNLIHGFASLPVRIPA